MLCSWPDLTVKGKDSSDEPLELIRVAYKGGPA